MLILSLLVCVVAAISTGDRCTSLVQACGRGAVVGALAVILAATLACTPGNVHYAAGPFSLQVPRTFGAVDFLIDTSLGLLFPLRLAGFAARSTLGNGIQSTHRCSQTPP